MITEENDDDITPTTELLLALSAQPFDWRRTIGELLDNALDARASNVALIFEKDRLIVTDNGEGCPDIKEMFRLGKHVAHGRRGGLGRYGIGFKDASLWLGGATNVDTVRDGMRRNLSVSWERVRRQRAWRIDRPTEVRAAPGERGTRIVFSGIERQVPHGKAWDDLVGWIGYTFGPAIAAGKQVTISRKKGSSPEPVRAFEAPPLTDIVEVELVVGDKRARLRSGIVAAGAPNFRAGITYAHRHRVIIDAGTLGTREYSPSRVFGLVTLDDSWVLTKNKDSVSQHLDELEAAVFDALHPMLVKAATQSMEMASTQLLTQATDMLNGALPGKRRRGDGDQGGGSGQGGGDGGDGPERKPRKRGEGTRPRVRGGKVLVDLGDVAPPNLGEVKGRTVLLAKDHPFIARLVKRDDREGLVFAAAALLCEHTAAQARGRQEKFDFAIDPEAGFAGSLGKLLEDAQAVEVAPESRVAGASR